MITTFLPDHLLFSIRAKGSRWGIIGDSSVSFECFSAQMFVSQFAKGLPNERVRVTITLMGVTKVVGPTSRKKKEELKIGLG